VDVGGLVVGGRDHDPAAPRWPALPQSQVSENLLDDCGRLDHREQSQLAAAPGAALHLDAPHPAAELGPPEPARPCGLVGTSEVVRVGRRRTRRTQIYSTGTFSDTGSLATAREGFTATLLPSGKMLVVGGSGGVSATASAELYDPATGTFSAAGSLATARESHTATLLDTGRVLVTGGYAPCSFTDGGSSCPPVPPPELYHPDTGTFSVTGCLAMPRSGHTATLLPSGKVLVVGGVTPSDGGVSATASAELYAPE
jgi:hypothetical protein